MTTLSPGLLDLLSRAPANSARRARAPRRVRRAPHPIKVRVPRSADTDLLLFVFLFGLPMLLALSVIGGTLAVLLPAL